VIVASVDEGSPAERAGLRRGDVILRIAGEKIRNYEDARRALYGVLVDDVITFEVRRGGTSLETLTLHVVERT